MLNVYYQSEQEAGFGWVGVSFILPQSDIRNEMHHFFLSNGKLSIDIDLMIDYQKIKIITVPA